MFIVGPEPIILRRWYDENQHWFDFMDGVIFLNDEPPVVPPHQQFRNVPQSKLNKTYAAKPEHSCQIYIYEAGVEQYVLPFEEFRRVSHKQLKRIEAAHFPTWDKNPETKRPYTISIVEKPFDPGAWCMEHLEGRFHCNTRSVICQLEIDALRAKLAFS